MCHAEKVDCRGHGVLAPPLLEPEPCSKDERMRHLGEADGRELPGSAMGDPFSFLH